MCPLPQATYEAAEGGPGIFWTKVTGQEYIGISLIGCQVDRTCLRDYMWMNVYGTCSHGQVHIV